MNTEKENKFIIGSEMCSDIQTDLLSDDLDISLNLLFGMSHEMRTYMNSIVSFSFLMKYSNYDNNECEEFNNQVLVSCEQLIRLFDSFIYSEIIEKSSQSLKTSKRKFNIYINSIFSEFREILMKANHKDVVLLTENTSSDLLEVTVDFEKMSEVIKSIFYNAVKNTQSGYIKIVSYVRNDKLEFYIVDTGEEYNKYKEFIYSEDMNESLALFYDISSAINIVLARKILGLLHGTIWIERNDLNGSRVCFSVPIKQDNEYKYS